MDVRDMYGVKELQAIDGKRDHRQAGVADGCQGCRQIHQMHHLAAEHIAQGVYIVGKR